MPEEDTQKLGEKHFRLRRRACLIGAALVAFPLPMDFHYGAWRLPVVLRLVWAAMLLACVPLIRPRKWRPVHALECVGGFGSGLLASGIIAATGGSHGPRFGFLPVLPLVVLVLAPDLPWAAGATGLAVTLGGLAILIHDHQGAWFIGDWSLLAVTSAGLAILGALSSRRLARSERQARADHARAVAVIADTKRAAVVGSLGSTLAHRIGNPLSVIRSNLWLMLTNQEAKGLDPDTVEMLREGTEAVERVVQVLTELRALAGSMPETPMRCDLQAVARQVISSASVRRHAVEIETDLPRDLPFVWMGQQCLFVSMMAVLVNAMERAYARETSGRPIVQISGSRMRDFVVVRIAERMVTDESAPLDGPVPSSFPRGADDAGAVDLVIARAIVEGCGGDLDVESYSSLASTVRIRLKAGAHA